MKFTTEVVRMFNFDPHWSTPASHEVQTKKYVHRMQVQGVAEM